MITRAGYAGLQRHAMHWTGDNSSWWEHLWMSMPQLQNLALSGVAWAGVDVEDSAATRTESSWPAGRSSGSSNLTAATTPR